VTQAGTAALGYDARGNLTSNGSKAYTYWPENMLKSATGGVTLHYDGAGRLAEYNTNVSTRFVYDGPNLIAEVDNPAGAVLRRYVHGPGTDEPLVWYEGPGTSDRRFLHADERGSIVAVSNGAGTAIGTNSYDEYGIPGANNVGRFQYTGQTWFPELGLYNYKARIYDPALGRFLQPDPIGYDDGMNMYAYVGGDPVNGTDPAGLAESCINMRTYFREYYPHNNQTVREWSIPAASVCIGSSHQQDPAAAAAASAAEEAARRRAAIAQARQAMAQCPRVNLPRSLRGASGEWGAAIRNPIDASEANQLASEASRTVASIFGARVSGHNNHIDAFRHAYWSYRMTQEIGVGQAELFGTAHEVSAANPAAEQRMDLHNNAVGRALATNPALAGLPAALVIQVALAQGCLQGRP
jgi:RHS repeat-associated protein